MIVVFGAIVINLLIIWFMPKRMHKVEFYVIWFVLMGTNACTDILIANVFDRFDYGADASIGWKEYVAELLLPASFGIIFANSMPERWRKFLLYLAGWVAFSLGFEWLTVKTHYMTYKGWSLWYSGISYVVIFLFIRWNLHFLRKYRL